MIHNKGAIIRRRKEVNNPKPAPTEAFAAWLEGPQNHVRLWSLEEGFNFIVYLNNLVELWKNCKDHKHFAAKKARLYETYHKHLQAFFLQLEVRISQSAALYRAFTHYEGPLAQRNQVIEIHMNLLRWLLDQPEWKGHSRGLAVDAELPLPFYQEKLPEYAVLDGAHPPYNTDLREIDPLLFWNIWELPAIPPIKETR